MSLRDGANAIAATVPKPRAQGREGMVVRHTKSGALGMVGRALRPLSASHWFIFCATGNPSTIEQQVDGTLGSEWEEVVIP